ncbi:MAG: hypothetical protein HN509_04160 [Halobacteriovoraceae bacterium]|jgi:hypothetical protein|nr:hypothetical protein [Halobacteriovoraceae bacterium]MBT5093768.1 hypothetical protein [Halobacteriovoraceae bacterium]
MDDLHRILADHRSKNPKEEGRPEIKRQEGLVTATISEIPDLFFDDVLVSYKLTRIEVMILMYLYRRVWCRPNLYKVYGISQLLSHTEMSKNLCLSIEEIYQGLRKIEEYSFISTIRSGQYFVRKYFTKDLDEKYAQTYDDFEI